MGKNKSTKSDGCVNFADTQDLDDKKKNLPRGAMKQNVFSSKPK